MSAISVSKFITTNTIASTFTPPTSKFLTTCPFLSPKSRSRPHLLSPSPRKTLTPVFSNTPEAELSATEDEWLKKLPDKKKPLYSHSLPCIEAWLVNLGFYQSKEDRAVWLVEKPEWHAQLSLDVTDLYIRKQRHYGESKNLRGGLSSKNNSLSGQSQQWQPWYLKSGPGNLEKDVERRFSYALSREDIENAILGGP